MKTILMIAPNFPPTSAVGGIRSLKFAKYLPGFGWKPIVITLSAQDQKLSDATLLSELPPQVEIHRPGYFNYRKYLRGDIRKLLKPLERRYSFPDNYVHWNQAALRYIRKNILGLKKIDLIYASMGPHSALLLAQELKRRTGLPLVLDFRDPFSFSQYSVLDHKQNYQQRARRIEAAVLPAADHINVVTREWQERYAALYPQIAAKMSAIPNGYDETDFAALPAKRRQAVFTVGYNGTFSRLSPLAPLATAIEEIHRHKGIAIRLSIASATREKKMRSRFRGLYDRGLIEFKGHLPHRESLANLHQSDIVALTLNDIPATRGQIPAKTFEYLRIDRPILLLHKEHGQLADILRCTRTGISVPIDDHSRIVETLLDLQQRWVRQRLEHQPDWQAIAKFERQQLTAALAAIFDRLCGAAQAGAVAANVT